MAWLIKIFFHFNFINQILIIKNSNKKLKLYKIHEFSIFRKAIRRSSNFAHTSKKLFETNFIILIFIKSFKDLLTLSFCYRFINLS